MDASAFFHLDGDRFIANPVSAGPWREQSLMGRVVSGLIGFEIERRHLEPGFTPSRLTVELHRLPDFSPIRIETRVARAGGRIRVIEARFLSGEDCCATAVCQLLRQTEAPAGEVWKPADWQVPPPESLKDDETRWKWSLRVIVGGVGHLGPKRAWMRDHRELVEGFALTPFTRIAIAADFVSPFSTIGDKGRVYINTDVTLYLHRLPEQEWIGFEVTDHQSAAGIALGQCRLYDKLGPIGFAANAGLAQRAVHAVGHAPPPAGA